MENINKGHYDFDVIEKIAQAITQSKFCIAANKIAAKVESGFYGENEIATGEALYIEFKNFNRQELTAIQEESNIIAKDGYFITDDGLKMDYARVLNRVLDPVNIESQVERFLGNEFGEATESNYTNNLKAQKDFALEIFTKYFEKNNIEVSLTAIKDKSIFNIYEEVKELLPEIKSTTAYKTDSKFGVPSFELSKGGDNAVFNTGVEVKHLLNDKEFAAHIKHKIENPVKTENLQEDVWMRNERNKRPNLLKP